MAGARINFAEVEGGFDVLPEGQYECVIERVEVRESNSSDYNYLNFELKVTNEDYEDRRLWFIRSFSPKALPMMKDTFVALGVIEEDEEVDFEWDEDVDITPKEGPVLTNPDLEGIECVARVSNEMYDGTERNRVNGLGALNPEPTTKKGSPAKKSKSSNGRKASGSKKPASRKRSLR